MRLTFWNRGRGSRVWWLVMSCGLGAALALQQTPPQDPAVKLLAQADAAQGGKRAELLIHLAHLEVDRATQSYVQQHPEQGSAEWGMAEQHAAAAYQALQNQAAHGKKNGVRKVEIEVRKISLGLQDLAHGLEDEDRTPVEHAAKTFTDLRDHLLNLLFGDGNKGAK